METKPATNNELCYEDFEPFCQWKEKEGFKVLEVHLPGLRRQDVRVQINNLGILTISGKQSTDENTTTTPSRFQKEIQVSKKCNANEIRAKFSRGILSITIPSTQLPEYSKDSAGSGSGEKITWSSVNHYLISLRSIVVRPKLNKKTALTTAVVALVVALGGYAMYRYAK